MKLPKPCMFDSRHCSFATSNWMLNPNQTNPLCYTHMASRPYVKKLDQLVCLPGREEGGGRGKIWINSLALRYSRPSIGSLKPRVIWSKFLSLAGE